MTQATGSSFFTQAMAVATANTSSTALPELLAFVGSRLGQTRANQLIAKVGHLLTVEQQYTLRETYLYGSSRLGVINQQITLSSRVASVQNGSLMPVGNAMLNTDSVFFGTANALGLPKAIGARVLSRTWGLKQYELSNHLGNVQVTVSDKKMGVVGSNNVDFTSYQADIKTATDYYAYGMEMPGKAYQSTAYRYGMNTQEKDNEIYGPGNVFSALYWEYDARIARRWNVDPVVVPSLSNYHAFEGNPIMMVDPLGNSAGIFKKDPNTGKETKVSDFGDRQGFDIVLTGTLNEDGSMEKEGGTTEVYKLVDGKREVKIAENIDGETNGSHNNFGLTNGDLGNLINGIGAFSGIPEYFAGHTTIGTNLKIYPNGFIGDEYVSTFKIAKIGKLFGVGTFIGGTFIDIMGVNNYYTKGDNHPDALHPAQGLTNFGVGSWSLLTGPTGWAAGSAYYLGGFFPGGWEGNIHRLGNLRERNQQILGPRFNLHRDW